MILDTEEYQYWLSRVEKKGLRLRHAPEHIRANKPIALAAVQNVGGALEYVVPKLRNDKEVALASVQQYGWGLRFVSPELQKDKEVVMAAIVQQRDGKVLQCASPVLRNDRAFIMKIVQEDGWALEYASPDLLNDKEVVVVAVQQNGKALQYASPLLRNDKDVVMVAVKTNGLALQYASPQLKRDKEVVLAAIENDSEAFEYAEILRNDKDIVLAYVESNPDNVKHIHEDMKRDPDILIATGMFDEDRHGDGQERTTDKDKVKKKIVLSTRFSLEQSSNSQATMFTKLLKEHEYIQTGFVVYAPNAFDKKTCDPNWTDFDWPCRGTKDTCLYETNVLTEAGHPTDECCWRYSFRHQLQQAKDSGGFMIQLVERNNSGYIKPPTLGNGQKIEQDMAQQLQIKVFHVYRPFGKYDTWEYNFKMRHIEEVVTAIKVWYDNKCQDMSECIVSSIR